MPTWTDTCWEQQRFPWPSNPTARCSLACCILGRGTGTGLFPYCYKLAIGPANLVHIRISGSIRLRTQASRIGARSRIPPHPIVMEPNVPVRIHCNVGTKYLVQSTTPIYVMSTQLIFFCPFPPFDACSQLHCTLEGELDTTCTLLNSSLPLLRQPLPGTTTGHLFLAFPFFSFAL